VVEMSKRRSSSANEHPSKRSRPEQEEVEEDGEDDENVADNDQEDCTSDVVSDAGIVESITLKNFMCHSLLGPFAFGSNVNFVVGNNGSGKSAVLTALIVALGGNAQATNRGSSLKGFVKEGESSADVSITLRNKGRDAYKPEVYGPAIMIDLRITREGLRTYKLRGKSGQIVSTKKEELISILDNFNIQVNNPVSVLTQEMSKYFLHSKGEGDKYKFFMKATQLEQMREDFVYIKTTKHVTEDKVGQHSECLKDLKRKYLEKEDRYKSLASLDEMHSKVEELQKQMAWALVAEVEKELEPMKEKLRTDTHSTEKYDEKVDEWKNKVAEAEKKHKQIQEQLEGITQKVQELQPKCAELKTEAQRRNTLFKASEVRLQAAMTESQARAARVEQIQAELENLTHQVSTLGQQIDQYQHASTRAKEEQGKIRREHSVLQRSIDVNKRNLQTLESSRSNRLRRFGEHMPALLSAIQEAHRKGQFKQRPRGPLGYLISLRDPELALAVEVCLKGLLQAFICDNHEDEKVLQGLMAKMFPGSRRPSIITSHFLRQVHDTRKRAVNHPDYPSVLQALEIEDPVVTNCLIDQRGIESILLIKNRAEARRVMQGAHPPANCTQAFSKDGDQIYNNRSYTAEQTRANYLSGDVEEEIRYVPFSLLWRSGIWLYRSTEQSELLTAATIPSLRCKVHVVTCCDLSKTDQEVMKCKHHKKHYDEKRSSHLTNIKTLEANMKSKEQELETSVAKATEICPERMTVRRTARSLDSELNRLKAKINTQQEQQGDREEVVRQYHEALENYKNMAQQMKNLNSFIKSLDSVMNHRLQVYAELRRFLSARCKYYFDSMLAQRGYSGSMTFDHKNETLSISVQPGQGNKADLSDMRCLSGGERSFSTVCFVLSLWAITEAPFRCLDEFDVYMDMVNRRISMDMMLKVAAGQRYRQFIFLTPQSMSSLPQSKIIRILRLKDPDRGQNNSQRSQEQDQ
uniref:Structural maintenance of chromosomes protein 6 n=1 Tax=Amphiprion ocellaris TaxID=80972 RepID=A0AAQ5YGY2_AMPOC